jgi:hypothetical protein
VEPRRPGPGELVAGASGALLLVSTFLPWFALDFAVELPGRPGGTTVRGEGVDAWQAFAAIDLALLAVALAALALPLLGLAGLRPGRTPLPLVVAAGGALCALLVAYRLIEPPDLASAADTAANEIGRRLGAFFALLAAVGISWGGWRSVEAQEEPEPVAEPPVAAEPEPVERVGGPPIRSAGVAAFDEVIARMEPLLEQLWDSPAATRDEHESVPAAPGLYLFTRGDDPVYVGQAPNLRRRLGEHCRPSSGPSKATLAFEIAKRAARREGIDVDGPPSRLATSDEFVPYFASSKQAVAELPVRFIELESPELRTVFEVYAALALDTGQYGADDAG